MTAPVFRLTDVTLPGAPGRPRLDGVTLEIPGGVTAVVGASGAGKSSLLEALVGFSKPEGGSVTFTPPKPRSGGTSASGDEPARLPLFWLPSDLGLWPGETVRGHLRAVQPVRDDGAADALLARFGLTGVGNDRPGTLSAGERSRLAAARAVAADAAVLVLDEPLAHVDPVALSDLWDLLRGDWAANGRTVVFATHDPAAAVRGSERCVVMHAGRVTHAGETKDLAADPPTARVAALLGSSSPGSAVPGSAVPGSSSPGSSSPGSTVRALALAVLAVLGAGCGPGVDDAPPLRFSGVRMTALPNVGPKLPAPRGCGAAPDGTVFVLDNAGRVLAYGPDLELRRQWEMPANVNGNPEGVCVLPDGAGGELVAVADTHYHRVVAFTPGGEEVARFGEEGDGPGQFRYPVACCADAAGRLYVGEYGGNDRVQVFSPAPEFAFVRTFGGPGTGPGEFQRASGVAWAPGEAGGPGTVLVVDAFGDRVQVFSEEGGYRGVLGGDRAVSLHSPYDIDRAADGTLWVPEYHGGRVTALRPDGSLRGRWGREGTGEGNLRAPWGLAADRGGRVWVADTENRRLVVLDP